MQPREAFEGASPYQPMVGAGARPVTATPFTLRIGSAIPPRRWLYDRRLVSGYVALTVSPGGLGKSTLVICEALSMVTARSLLGQRPPRALKVWLFNGEDDATELERRVTACAQHYGVTASDIGERLFVDSGRDGALVLATQTREGVFLHQDRAEALIDELKARDIDVLIVDPFVTTHEVPENDNTSINAVVALWREIADRSGCAIELVHHAQKAALLQGADLGISQSRGASALIDGVRAARFLVAMTADEAVKCGLDSHAGFFQVIQGKANLAPRAERAAWRRLVSVPLLNGTDLYPDGDYVGVPEVWEKPSAFDGVGLDDLAEVQRRVENGEYRESEQSPDWIGHVIGSVLGVDVGDFRGRTREQTADRARVKAILKEWLANDALRKDVRYSARDGRDVPFIVPGEPANAKP